MQTGAREDSNECGVSYDCERSPRQNDSSNSTQDNLAYLWAIVTMPTNMANIYAAGRILVHEMSFTWPKDQLKELAQELGKLYRLCREAIREGIIPEPWLSTYCGRPQQRGIDVHFHEDGGFHLGIHVDIEGYKEYPRGYIHSTGLLRGRLWNKDVYCRKWLDMKEILSPNVAEEESGMFDW